MVTKKKRKINIPLLLSSILLIIVLISLCFTSGILARYTTSASVSDKARVAKFNVSVENSDGNDYVIEFKQISFDGSYDSVQKAYHFNVQNKSEVAVRYKVELVFPEGTHEYLTVSRVDGSNLTWTGDKVIYEGKDLPPYTTGDAPTESEVLTFGVATGYLSDEPLSDNTLAFKENISFDVIVTLIQID